MKKNILFMLCLFFWGISSAQNPQITGDLMLCPNSSGTATVTNPTFDTYQWYSKFWFSADNFVAIPGATQPTFTYDWSTYDQSLFKVVAVLNGVPYESNVIQIDSYTWTNFSIGIQINQYVTFNPSNGALLLCPGGFTTASIYQPYNTGIQWFKDGNAIPGANQMTYLITAPGSYHAIAAPSFCPNNTSSNAALPVIIGVNNNCTLANNSATRGNFSMYPNPTNNLLSLNLSDESFFSAYQVIDTSGKVLLESNLILEQKTITIDVSSLANGFYFIQLQAGNQSVAKQFIKN